MGLTCVEHVSPFLILGKTQGQGICFILVAVFLPEYSPFATIILLQEAYHAGRKAYTNVQTKGEALTFMEEYAIIGVTRCLGSGWPHPFRKGVVFMTTYEALTFAIAFATLMVLVVKKK